MSTGTVITETREQAMRRLLDIARESGVRLCVSHAGDFYATSVSEPGRLYLVTPDSCGCKGFQSHRRCRHVAALWSHLGRFTEDVVVAPEAGPKVELQHLPGQWIDDDLTPAGMLRYRHAITSLYQDGVELIRVSGEDRVSAVASPGTDRATDVQTHGSHFDTVVAWIRTLTPEANLERLLADAELFHPAEFVEEAELAVA